VERVPSRVVAISANVMGTYDFVGNPEALESPSPRNKVGSSISTLMTSLFLPILRIIPQSQLTHFRHNNLVECMLEP